MDEDFLNWHELLRGGYFSFGLTTKDCHPYLYLCRDALDTSTRIIMTT